MVKKKGKDGKREGKERNKKRDLVCRAVLLDWNLGKLPSRLFSGRSWSKRARVHPGRCTTYIHCITRTAGTRVPSLLHCLVASILQSSPLFVLCIPLVPPNWPAAILFQPTHESSILGASCYFNLSVSLSNTD